MAAASSASADSAALARARYQSPVVLGLLALLVAAQLTGCARRESATQPNNDASAAAEKQSPPVTLRVAAASDLKFSLPEVIAAFQVEHPGVQVEPTFGSSGNFYAQLINKAPFDLYLSADIEYPRKLIEAGHAPADSLFLYGIGQIVVWAPNAAPFHVADRGLDVLEDESIRKIAIANPAHAPYGRAAEAALKKLGLYDAVKDRLVLGDNIAQTAQFVESGAADVGIIALSLALAPPMRDKGHYAVVPADSYPRLEQGGVILNWATDRQAADAFRRFLISPAAREILKRFGFETPEG